MASKPRESLQQSLARLRAELAASPRVDPKARQLLHEVLADIELLLQQTPTEAASGEPGVDRSLPRLEQLAIEFDTEHPGIAGSLRQLLDLLGRGGL